MSFCLRAFVFVSLAATSVQAQGVTAQPLRLVPPAASGTAPSSSAPAEPSPAISPEQEEAEVRVRAELEAVLDAAQDHFIVDSESLYTEACIEHGYVGPLLEELELLVESEEQPEARRRVAEWTIALLLRRRGDLKAALERFEPFAEDAELAPDLQRMARLHRAELLDALGRVPDATSAFRELLEFELDEELETHVRLRVALLEMSDQGDSASGSDFTDMLVVPDVLPSDFAGEFGGELGEEFEGETEALDAPEGAMEKDPLTLFALEEGRDPMLRNRAAVVLGLSDRPAEAIELFQVQEGDKKPFRSEVRLAEWGIRAEQPEVAQEHAWRAVRSATLRRDRDYALAVLVEAHRLDESLDTLVDKIAATPNLDDQMRRVWIELLRERGRYAEAIALFRAEGDAVDGEPFSIEERRQLLEMYREKGDEDVMISVYRELIASEPTEVEWREGLSRAFLERGERDAARELWSDFLTSPALASRRLEGAQVLMDLGLDDLALQAAELCITDQSQPYAALIFLFGMHKNRGRLEEAEAALERMEALAPPDAAERFQLADSWEQLGRQDRAVTVLETVRAARGLERSGEDLEMRLAWLYSEIGEEETALERWREIWLRLKSVSRRRYAEGRMMTVASRLGVLADIAIDLEQKLIRGEATERDSGLLVRLYTKVGDPVSAAEVVTEFMKQSGGSEIDTLQEKGRVYLACNDYYNYEKVVRRLIEIDSEGEGDYLKQLAMSQLERGKPDEARVVLARLKVLEAGTESAEFEAGVLALAGLREEAIRAYRKGIAENPGRIESYLLMADLMKELEETERAVGMFQNLAETAEKDDLFTIAIDGLLNVEAPKPVMQWARRITLERLASKHDKMYLYQLLSDLAEQVDDRGAMLTSLESSLSISGERRPTVLRELMDLAKGNDADFDGQGWPGDPDKHLAFGRRLIGLSEVVPPQVYLDLGGAFLKAGDPGSATKTFRLASDLPDFPQFQRNAAGLFERAGYREEALDLYKRVLVAQSGDIGLMVKIGELEEQNGRDEAARRLYCEALERLFARQPLTTNKEKKEEKRGSFFSAYGSRNVGEFDKYYSRLLKNLLVVLPAGEAANELMAEQSARLEADLAVIRAERENQGDGEVQDRRDTDRLGRHLRVLSRGNFLRRLSIAYGRPEVAEDLDLALLEAFPSDNQLLETFCQTRIRWGLYGSVRRLLDRAPRDEKEIEQLRFLVGDGLDERSSRRLTIDQTQRLFLPLLIAGKETEAGVLLRRTDFTAVPREEIESIAPLFSATLYLEDPGLTLQIARDWLRLHVKYKSSPWMISPVIDQCRSALDDESFRSLSTSFVDEVLADPEETSHFLASISQFQGYVDEPLITEEQGMEIIEGFKSYGWGDDIGPVLLLLPQERRGSALRTVFNKVPPTSQATFLMWLIGNAEEDFGDSVLGVVKDVFPGTLEDADDIFAYYVDQIAGSRKNHEIGLAMCEAVIAYDPESWTARAGRAKKLLLLDREEEALEQAERVFIGLLDNDGEDWRTGEALQSILDKFLPDHLERFQAALRNVEAKRGKSVELVKSHLDLAWRSGEEDAPLPILEKAVQDFPEELSFLEQLRRLYIKQNRRAEALALHEKIVELDPSAKTWLYRYWLGRQNPIAALALKEELMGESSEFGEAGLDDEFLAMDFAPGTVIMTASGSIVEGSSTDQAREDQPTIAKVKDAVVAEDFDAARTVFRRLWRRFPKGEDSDRGSAIFVFGDSFGTPQMNWPKDEQENDESRDESEGEKAPARGGLEDWTEEGREEPEKPRSAYDALAEFEFGVDEMQRLLRSKEARELDSQRSVFKGLLRARVLAQGEEKTRDELIETLESGRAGKRETTMLLTLLDEHPELQNDKVRTVIGDLVRSVRPVDVGPLRALARVQAREGNVEEAQSLYTWLATRTERENSFLGDESPTISQRDLVRDVRENLEGEARLKVIDAVIRFADRDNSPWNLQSYDLLVLDTYMGLLEPEAALAKSLDVVENATDFSKGPRRDVAKKSALLLAQNGRLEDALHCLEYGLCKLDPNIVEGEASYWESPKRPGSMGDEELREFFPKDASKFEDPKGWLKAAGAAMAEWLDAERLGERTGERALCVIAMRLQAAGETEAALELLRSLGEAEGDSAPNLFVVDLLRECGEDALADQMERRGLAQGNLMIERIHEVVERELESRGPQAALALGAPIAEEVLNERLLAVLLRAAEEGDLEAEAAKWKALAEEAAAARTRLKEIAEEERLAAKGE